MKTEITWEEVKIFFLDRIASMDSGEIDNCILRFKNLSQLEKIDLFHSMRGIVTQKMEEKISRCNSKLEKDSYRSLFERRLIFNKEEWIRYLFEKEDEKPTELIL